MINFPYHHQTEVIEVYDVDNDLSGILIWSTCNQLRPVYDQRDFHEKKAEAAAKIRSQEVSSASPVELKIVIGQEFFIFENFRFLRTFGYAQHLQRKKAAPMANKK